MSTGHVDAQCLRCGELFRLGDPPRCGRAPDMGDCEALPHHFVDGRRDGRCGALNDHTGLYCGYEAGDENRHIQGVL